MHIYFISDAHVMERLYAHRPQIKGDSYRALDSCVDLVAYANIVVFCGDNFNTHRPSPRDILAMQEAISRMTGRGAKVYAIQGNHDRCRESWMLACGARDLASEPICEEGLVIRGMDFCFGGDLEQRLEKICADGNDADILVMHQGFSFNDPFGSSSINPDDIPECIGRALVSGHIHKHQTVTNSRGVEIVSVGAVFDARKGDPPGNIVRLDTDTFKFEKILVPPPRLKMMFKILTDEEYGRALDEIGRLADADVDDMPVVYADYGSSVDRRLSQDPLASRKAHILENFLEDSIALLESSCDVVAPDREEVLRGICEGRVFAMVSDLMDSSPEEVLQREDEKFREKLKLLKESNGQK